MKIGVACDHRGYEAKRKLIPLLIKMGHQVEDYGCDGSGSVDYPDYAAPAARAVAAGEVDAAVLLDGSGIGMSITANKVPGVRAALAHDDVTSRRAREHHHCNVLCLGTDLLTEDHIRSIVEVFLAAEFAPGRHARRIDKLRQIELEYGNGGNGRLTPAPSEAATP
jgi:ribose 5-phosphate isomerase B